MHLHHLRVWRWQWLRGWQRWKEMLPSDLQPQWVPVQQQCVHTRAVGLRQPAGLWGSVGRVHGEVWLRCQSPQHLRSSRVSVWQRWMHPPELEVWWGWRLQGQVWWAGLPWVSAGLEQGWVPSFVGERGPVGCFSRQVFDVYAAAVCLTRSVLCPKWLGAQPSRVRYIPDSLLCFFLEDLERCKSCWMALCLRRDLFH